MRKILTAAVLLLLIILASCDPYSYTFKEDGRQVALVYGLDYVGTNINSLGNTQFDAQEVSTVFNEYGYELTGSQNNNDASKSEIAADISSQSDLGKEDTLYFYFSGHGLLDTELDTSYIVPHFTDSYTYAINNPEEVFISPDWLFSRLQATGAGTIIVILDICNSGGFVFDRSHEVDGLPENYTDDWPSAFSLSWERFFNQNGQDNPYPNIHVISAAGKDELSYESDSIQNGYYTYYMLQSLGYDHEDDLLNTSLITADGNKDGLVTLSELYSDSFARFEALYLNNPLLNPTPYYPHITGGSGDPILFYLD